MNRNKILASAVAAAFVTATFVGRDFLATLVPTATAETAAAEPRVVGLPDFTELVNLTGPAVVNISATRLKLTKRREGPSRSPQEEDAPESFRHYGMPTPDREGPMRRSGGSGFIISADGLILTNAHVVDGAEELNVKLSDKREFKAKVIGVDEVTDVALIKIEGSKLPVLKIGDSSALKVGEWVIAIGSPFGFDNTVSAGVVSAKTRSLPNGNYVPFIQTDVAINPGNSGGPLLNLKGEVVGINSQIYSQSGGYMGLSFAIPMDVAMEVETQLAQGGKMQRGRLGVSVQSLDQDLARSFGMTTPQGALVSQVQEDMPAAKAGIKAGDVILKVDGDVIEDSASLSRLIAGKKPGETVAINLLRDGQSKQVPVALGSMEGGLLATTDKGDADPVKAGRLGAVVQQLNEEARRALGDGRGVMVTEVEGAAERAGIRPGDVILAVNSAPVTNPADLKRLIAGSGDQIALLVHRDDAEIFVPVKLG